MSKANTMFVANIIIENNTLYSHLFEFILRNEEPLSRRAVWISDYVLEKRPLLFTNKRICTYIDKLEEFSHEALRRHGLRMLSNYKIPESHEGILLDKCFKFLLETGSSTATKVWAMDILYNFSKEEPDLIPELIAAIEINLENATSGLKNHSEKLINKLRKQQFYRKLENGEL